MRLPEMAERTTPEESLPEEELESSSLDEAFLRFLDFFSLSFFFFFSCARPRGAPREPPLPRRASRGSLPLVPAWEVLDARRGGEFARPPRYVCQ